MLYLSKLSKAAIGAALFAVCMPSVYAQDTDQLTETLERPEREEPRRANQISGIFADPVGLFFSAMDQNADAVISHEELSAGLQAEWSGFDRAPGGARFMQWSEKALGSIEARPTFLRFDTDFSGSVSEEEFERTLRGAFSRLDKDSDGNLTRAEMIIRVDAPRPRSRAGRNDTERTERLRQRRPRR